MLSEVCNIPLIYPFGMGITDLKDEDSDGTAKALIVSQNTVGFRFNAVIFPNPN